MIYTYPISYVPTADFERKKNKFCFMVNCYKKAAQTSFEQRLKGMSNGSYEAF